MRQPKTIKPAMGMVRKASKVAPPTEQLSLDFEGREPGKTLKVAAKAGARIASHRQARRTVLDILEKPKS
jgi:hypothetical protein